MISSSFRRKQSDIAEDIVMNESNGEVPVVSEMVHSSVVNKTKLQCIKCNKTFQHKSSLSRHKLSCSTSKVITLLKCPKCIKEFERADTLKRHLNVCKGMEKKNWKCDRCNKEFNYKWFLTRHRSQCLKKCQVCRKRIDSDTSHVCNVIVKLSHRRSKDRNIEKTTEKTKATTEFNYDDTFFWRNVELAMLLELGTDETKGGEHVSYKDTIENIFFFQYNHPIKTLYYK